MKQIIDLLLAAKETMAWILFIGIVMVCLAANSMKVTYNGEGRTGKWVAIVIVALALIYGLAVL